MATSFGKSKKSIPSTELTAAQLLQMHRQFLESPFDDWKDHKRQTILLAIATTQWFSSHPINLKNMATWGELLFYHVQSTVDFVDQKLAKPLADYFTYVSSISEDNLFAQTKGKSRRYDTFCDVVQALSSSALYDPSKIMVVIAEYKMTDLDALMKNLRTMREQQYEYDIYTLDSAGEFEDLPEAILLRTLLGLSFTGSWEIPQDNPTYHDMWEVIDDGDTELPTPTYDAECDIIAHLTSKLPGSTYDALEYFEYHGRKLQPNQLQHIMGMDLSCLEFPRGLEKLIDTVYFNQYFDSSESVKLLKLMNPATHVLATHLDLYDTYEDVIKNLDSIQDLESVFKFSNSMRQVHLGDTLVEKLGYSPTD